MPAPNTLQAVMDRARSLAAAGENCRIAVAGAQDLHVLEAVDQASREGFARAVLFGDREEIVRMAGRHGINLEPHTIVHVAAPENAAREAVAASSRGECQLLMKGFVSTSVLLRQVLSREFNLRTGNLLSHVAVMEVPAYPKLFAITDGGMVVQPGLPEKMQIIRNASRVMHSLGVARPKVAMLSMVDFIYPGLPTSVENAVLGKMGDRGQFPSCDVDGPLTFDAAFSLEAAKYAGLRSRVAGKTDILVVNSIEEGNTLIKSLSLLAEARFGGVIAGARVPVALVSRTDSAYNKKAAIALGLVLGYDQRQSLPDRRE